jgi:pilus assembly protein CpaE
VNEEAIAYSVSLFQKGDGGNCSGAGGLGGIYAKDDRVDGGGGNAGGDGGRGEVARMFTSSELCRVTLRDEPATVPVVVCNASGSVTPINLAAALCMDTPERDVYLIEDMPTRALAGRARAAGIRGILDNSQAQRLFALGQESVATASQEATDKGVSAKAPTLPTPPASPVFSLPSTPSTFSLSPAFPVSVSSEEGTEGISYLAGRESANVTFAAPVASERSSIGQGRAIGVFSGRGGVGKSTVALMMAVAAQRRGERVALVDLDMQFGDMGFLAGREPASSVQRLSLEQLSVRRDIPPLSDEALSLVLAPDRPEQAEELVFAIPWLLDELVALRDLVVINTGSFWTDVHARVLQRCDHVALLTDQRATSIEACKQVIDLCLRLQVPQARFLFLLNGCGRHAALTPQDVSFALGGVEVFGLADGGTLVDELLALGCPLELLASSNAFVASLEALLDTLTGGLSTSVSSESLRKGADRGVGRGAKIFDIATLRDFFKGARRVAT